MNTNAHVVVEVIDDPSSDIAQEAINEYDPRDDLFRIIEEKNADDLHAWIRVHVGVDIPRKAVCAHEEIPHCSPFDFMRDYLFGEIDYAIVVANRSGGKTFDFAILDAIMSYLYEDAEIATVGAIQQQAQRCYNYFKEISSRKPFSLNVHNTTMSKTTLKNGSEVQVLTGTVSGVNSPHPQVLFIDEIDLMNWNILQQALSMPQSKKGVPSRTILTSTRKYATGPMQRMIEQSREKGYKVYMWCIWEVVEPLPEDEQLKELIFRTFGKELPRGIVGKTDGYYLWTDVITKYTKSLDRETWEVEWTCKRPGKEGLIYGSSYSDDENLLPDSLDWMPPRMGYIYLFEDCGFGENHPNVVLFVWISPEFDRMVIFDELYLTGQGTDEIWSAIDEKLHGYGHNLPNRIQGRQGTIRGWVVDPHAHTEIKDRKLKGAPILDPADWKGAYIIKNGITLVKSLFERGKLMLTERCVLLREELLSYKKKQNPDGTFSDTPEKKNDHGPDCIRYGAVKLGHLILKATQSMAVRREAEKRLESENTRPKPTYKPITGIRR